MTSTREIIHSDAAPSAIGPYSQAVKVGDTVYISGQIPLDPATGELVEGDFKAQVEQVFDNLMVVAKAAGAGPQHAVRVGLYLTDMAQFGVVNEVMAARFDAPYPSRAAIGVAALPKNAAVEADAILVVD
ncbi:RidA family protein [Salinisphaera japonica]|uniref:Endoribonuclease n=1 Tax=Salinisphaera japonica YTM-1 TaxID=1209778 RepID=A0A423PMF5_9GAMM|nr:RidA family protein [Salinisphaera japonica]ROO26805.1 endoribonuclease [Salinisphaera japonica YTM-1]